MAETREPQYEVCFDVLREAGRASFGLMSNQVWHEDPKRLVFLLGPLQVRRQDVQRAAAGAGGRLCRRLRHAGRAARGSARHGRRFRPFVHRRRQAADRRPLADRGPRARHARGPCSRRFRRRLCPGRSGAHPRRGRKTVSSAIWPPRSTTMARSSSACHRIQSQAYASPPSRAGHVNCKDGKGLKETVQRFFHNVFIFSMNDEVVHTGFHAMANYLIALGCNKKRGG